MAIHKGGARPLRPGPAPGDTEQYAGSGRL